MITIHCLKAQGGIIVPVLPVFPEEYFKKITKKDISVKVAEYGFDVIIKDLTVPILEFMMDFFVENRSITIYLMIDDEYMWEPVYAVELAKDELVEARGVYKHLSMNTGIQEP